MENNSVTQDDLHYEYSEHKQYPSRHGLGEVVLFQPNLALIEYEVPKDKSKLGKYFTDTDKAVKAQVVGIKFVAGKVLYDLAVYDSRRNEFYDVLPICNVDSYMVLDCTERV